MQLKKGSWRFWFFCTLIAVTVVLMIVSFSKPWWTAYVAGFGGKDAVRIYGYGLSHSLVEFREYVIEDETPLYQNILAWVYIIISAGLVLYSIRLKGKYSRWLLGGTGAIYIIYSIIAMFVVIAGRLEDLGYPLQGRFVIDLPANAIYIYTNIHFGYYLALSTGVLCVILALMKNTILGKSSLVSDHETTINTEE